MTGGGKEVKSLTQLEAPMHKGTKLDLVKPTPWGGERYRRLEPRIQREMVNPLN